MHRLKAHYVAAAAAAAALRLDLGSNCSLSSHASSRIGSPLTVDMSWRTLAAYRKTSAAVWRDGRFIATM